MKLPDRVIERVKELADGISYGSILIRINESVDSIAVSSQVEERIPNPRPQPGQIALENQRREG
jgi:hypothetical protein